MTIREEFERWFGDVPSYENPPTHYEAYEAGRRTLEPVVREAIDKLNEAKTFIEVAGIKDDAKAFLKEAKEIEVLIDKLQSAIKEG